MNKFKCIHCGDYFTPHEDTIELLEEGFITKDMIDTCEECGRDLLNLPDNNINDSDTGL